MPLSGAEKVPKAITTGSTTAYTTAWQLYSVTISKATLESLIGNTLSYSSNLRAVTGSNSISLTVTPQGGSQQSIQAPSMQASVDFTATDITGGSSGTGDKPTGKVYSKITIMRADGTFATYVISPLVPFTVPVADIFIIGQGQPLAEIIYEKYLHIDRDVYNMPQTFSFSNSGSTDNFGARVIGDEITKVGIPNNAVSKIKPNEYTILRIPVTQAEIESKLSEIGDATGGGVQQLAGKVEFYHKAGIIKAVDSSDTYNIQIPAETVTLDLGGFKITGGNPCEIDGESCNPVGGGPDFSGMLLVGGIVAIFGLVGAGAVLLKPKK